MAAGAILGGTALSAFSQLQQGKAQAKALERSAEAAEKSAQLEQEAAAFNAEKHALSARQVIGATEAGFGAAGVESTSGSVLAVMAASHINAEMDRLSIIYEGDIKAFGFRQQAALDRKAAKAAKAGGILSAFATAGAGAAQAGASSGGGSAKATSSRGGGFGSAGGGGGGGRFA